MAIESTLRRSFPLINTVSSLFDGNKTPSGRGAAVQRLESESPGTSTSETVGISDFFFKRMQVYFDT